MSLASAEGGASVSGRVGQDGHVGLTVRKGPASGGKGSYAKYGIYAQAAKDPADTGIVVRYWNPSFTIAK